MMGEKEYPPSIFSSSVKLEYRAFSKVFADEPRTFMPSPFYSQLCWMQYFTALDESIIKYNMYLPFSMGYTEYYQGANKLARYLRWENEIEKNEPILYIESDVSGWDRTTQLCMIMMGWEALSLNFPESYSEPAHKQRLINMLHDLAFTPIMLEKGDVFLTTNGIKSGHAGTLTFNSIIHIMMILCILCAMILEWNPKLSVEEIHEIIRKTIRYKVQGDDMIGSVRISKAIWFSVDKWKELVYSMFGYKLKHFKTSFDLSDLEFLGSKLIPNGYGGYVALQNRQKIIDSLSVHKNADKRFIMAKLLGQKTRSYPDPVLFHTLKKRVSFCWKEWDAILKIPTPYDEIIKDHVFTYEKLRSMDLTDSMIRTLHYGFQSGEEDCSAISDDENYDSKHNQYLIKQQQLWWTEWTDAATHLLAEQLTVLRRFRLLPVDIEMLVCDYLCGVGAQPVWVGNTYNGYLYPIPSQEERFISVKGKIKLVDDVWSDPAVRHSNRAAGVCIEHLPIDLTCIVISYELCTHSETRVHDLAAEPQPLIRFTDSYITYLIGDDSQCTLQEDEDPQTIVNVYTHPSAIPVNPGHVGYHNRSCTKFRVNVYSKLFITPERALKDNFRGKKNMAPKANKNHAGKKGESKYASPTEKRKAKRARKAKRKAEKMPKGEKKAVEKEIKKDVAKATQAPKQGYASTVQGAKAMTNAENKLNPSKYNKQYDEWEDKFEGDWPGVAALFDAANPPTFLFNANANAIPMNPLALGGQAANAAKEAKEYRIEYIELSLKPAIGLQNTIGTVLTAIEQDPAYLAISAQAVNKDYVSSIKPHNTVSVYNTESTVRSLKYKEHRGGWWKCYQSAQTIAGAQVYAETRECYQFSIVGCPDAATPSISPGIWQIKYHIRFRGSKLPVTLPRVAAEQFADSIMELNANEDTKITIAQAHQCQVDNRKFEHDVLRVFPNPKIVPSLRLEVEALKQNVDFDTTGNMRKRLRTIIQLIRNYDDVRRGIIVDNANYMNKMKWIRPPTVPVDVPVSAIPVVIVDPTTAIDSRLSNLASAAKVSNTGTLQTTGAGGTLLQVNLNAVGGVTQTTGNVNAKLVDDTGASVSVLTDKDGHKGLTTASCGQFWETGGGGSNWTLRMNDMNSFTGYTSDGKSYGGYAPNSVTCVAGEGTRNDVTYKVGQFAGTTGSTSTMPIGVTDSRGANLRNISYPVGTVSSQGVPVCGSSLSNTSSTYPVGASLQNPNGVSLAGAQYGTLSYLASVSLGEYSTDIKTGTVVPVPQQMVASTFKDESKSVFTGFNAPMVARTVGGTIADGVVIGAQPNNLDSTSGVVGAQQYVSYTTDGSAGATTTVPVSAISGGLNDPGGTNTFTGYAPVSMMLNSGGSPPAINTASPLQYASGVKGQSINLGFVGGVASHTAAAASGSISAEIRAGNADRFATVSTSSSLQTVVSATANSDGREVSGETSQPLARAEKKLLPSVIEKSKRSASADPPKRGENFIKIYRFDCPNKDCKDKLVEYGSISEKHLCASCRTQMVSYAISLPERALQSPNPINIVTSSSGVGVNG